MAEPTRDATIAAIRALDPRSRDLIIRTIIGEAGGESDEGRAAVASVIRNRMAAGRYGGTSGADVVLARGQFEPWARDDARARMLAVPADSPLYGRVGAIVDRTFSGEMPDPTGGATHFFSPDVQAGLGRDAPAWGRGAPMAAIGTHRFFAPEGTGTAPQRQEVPMNLTLDQIAMGLPGQGKMPTQSGAPLNLAAAGQGQAGPLGMLAGMFGGGKDGQAGLDPMAAYQAFQQAQQAPEVQPMQPMQMPIPPGLQNGLVQAILRRGGLA